MRNKNKKGSSSYYRIIELNKVNNLLQLRINLTLRNWIVVIFLIFPAHNADFKVEHLLEAIVTSGALQQLEA